MMFRAAVMLVSVMHGAIVAQSYALQLDRSDVYKWVQSAIVEDFDRDGDRDILLVHGVDPFLHMNDGFGRFTDETASRLPKYGNRFLQCAIAVDADGDGDLDIVMGGLAGTADAYLENDGSGRFRDATRKLPVGSKDSSDVLSADFNGDGYPDIAFSMSGASPAVVRILLNDGTGDFSRASGVMSIPEDSVVAMASGDFDKDGDVDLAFARHQAATAKAEFDSVWWNDGKGNFANRTVLGSTATSSKDIVAGDFDGDGDADLCLVYHALPRPRTPLRYFRNDGRAGFRDASAVMPGFSTGSAESLCATDYDQDGDLDLVLLMVDSGVFIVTLENLGSDAWRLASGAPSAGGFMLAFAIADADGDGDLDYLTFANKFGFGEKQSAWNLKTQLLEKAPPEVGKGYSLELWSRDSQAIGLPFLALAPRLLPTPLGLWRLDMPTMVALGAYAIPVGGGHAKLSLPIPNRPSLRGLRIYVQGVMLEGTRLSRVTNALSNTIR